MDEYQNGMLGKRNQAQKATHCTIPFTCHSGKGKTKNRKGINGCPGLVIRGVN